MSNILPYHHYTQHSSIIRTIYINRATIGVMVESTPVEKTDRVTVPVEPDLKARMEAAAESEGMALAGFMRWLFLQWEKQQAKERQS